MNLIHEIEKERMKKDLPSFNVGDTVDVESLIREGQKERKQIFSGVVISIRGRGIRRVFTVRRIVQGEGVERVFPFHSPLVSDVQVKKRGYVRRAKLYYLQKRSGKGARIRERLHTQKAAKAPKAKESAPKAEENEAP